jgi:hypothetical protein
MAKTLKLGTGLDLPADEAVTQKCACGCGLAVPIARHTDTKRGYVAGQPCQFRPGHNKRKATVKQRYRFVFRPEHPNGPVITEHIAIAEAALGKYLPKGAQVHHVDGNQHNNANANLVICQDQAYHQLLEVRTKILKAGGNPDSDNVCKNCGPKPRTNFHRQSSNRSTGLQNICRSCRSGLDRARTA